MRAQFASRFVLALLLAPAFSHAQEPGSLVLKTDHVVVFKDGYGLFFKTATGTADSEGVVHTEEVPNALLGTMWAVSADGSPVAMRAELIERQARSKSGEPLLGTSMLDLLRSKKGLEATLYLSGEETVEGRIGAVLENGPDKDELPRVVSVSPPASANRPVLTLSPVTPPDLFVQIEGKDRLMHFVKVADIRRLALAKDGAGSGTPTSTARETVKRLSFDLGPEAAGKQVDIKLFYLRDGLQWVPSYRISGDLKDSTTMALQGELVNEAEDIAGAQLSLVVGVPNFRFRDRNSPLALEADVHRAIASLRDPQMQNAFSNALMSQVAYGGVGAGGSTTSAGTGATYYDPSTEGQQGQDLFFYSVPSFSLKKGARATRPIWSAPVQVEHLYKLDIVPVRGRDSAIRYASHLSASRSGNQYRAEEQGPIDINPNKVWHLLEMKNETALPWTTGAALVLQGGLPIGQDMIAYTAPGATGSVPLTIAMDVQSDHSEIEIERTPSPKKWQDYEFLNVRKKGTVKLVNRRKEASRVEVSVATGGSAQNVSDGGQATLNDFKSSDWDLSGDYASTQVLRLNQHSDISWELTLQPGETKELTYEVLYHVR